jgi:chromosome segregation ATPase
MTASETQGERGEEPLRERVARLERENAHLRERLDDLEARLDETTTSASSLPAGAKDYRDRAVLKQLDAGDVVDAAQMHSLYDEHTDIRDSDTRLDRVKHLLESDAFERTGDRYWRHTP